MSLYLTSKDFNENDSVEKHDYLYLIFNRGFG